MSYRLQTEHLNDLNFSQSLSRETVRTSSKLSTSSSATEATSTESTLTKLRNLSLTEKKNLFVESFKKTKSESGGSYTKPKGDENEVKVEKKKLTMSANERRKLNQNYIEDKLLLMARKDLDRQLSYSQLLIKREKTILMEQLMESKVVNGVSRANTKMEDVSALGSGFMSNRIRTAVSFNDASSRSIEVELGQQNSNVFDKFIDQKRRYCPGYLKQSNTTKYSLPIYEFDKVIEKIRRVNSLQRKICSKYKNHRKAEQRAQNYMTNKYLFRTFPELTQTFLNPQTTTKQEDEQQQQDINLPSITILNP